MLRSAPTEIAEIAEIGTQ